MGTVCCRGPVLHHKVLKLAPKPQRSSPPPPGSPPSHVASNILSAFSFLVTPPTPPSPVSPFHHLLVLTLNPCFFRTSSCLISRQLCSSCLTRQPAIHQQINRHDPVLPVKECSWDWLAGSASRLQRLDFHPCLCGLRPTSRSWPDQFDPAYIMTAALAVVVVPGCLPPAQCVCFQSREEPLLFDKHLQCWWEQSQAVKHAPLLAPVEFSQCQDKAGKAREEMNVL